jgi:Fibronectin type III domain
MAAAGKIRSVSRRLEWRNHRHAVGLSLQLDRRLAFDARFKSKSSALYRHSRLRDQTFATHSDERAGSSFRQNRRVERQSRDGGWNSDRGRKSVRNLSWHIRGGHGRTSGFSSLVAFAATTLTALLFFASSGFSGEPVMHTVTLSWDPSPTAGVAYRLHYGQQSGNYNNVIDVGNQTRTDVANLIDGTTYYFTVTAYDASGEESLPSEEFHYTPNPAVLLNISTRAMVQTGDKVLIAGFTVGGTGAKKMVIRALGPTLTGSGVTGVLSDTVLSIYAGKQLIATNDSWRSGNASALQALKLAPAHDAESAVVLTLTPGIYSAVVQGKNNKTGVALVEVYDIGSGDAP